MNGSAEPAEPSALKTWSGLRALSVVVSSRN
jgi:hypothetical protein